MNNSKILWALIISLFIGSNLIAQGDEKAKAIVIKAHEATIGKSSKSKMTMKIVRPDWSSEITMQSWSLGKEYYLIYIISPARDKGQVFLKRDNNMWNWMPAIGRMIKIPPSMMMSGWMGSDFNNDELMKENSLEVDYSHQFLPEETIDGIPCYQIELTPLPSAPVVWGKVIMWISKDKYFGLKSHFYDDDGKLINIQTASKIKVFGNKELPSLLELTPVNKPGHKTTLEITEAVYNVDNITESMFTQQMMKNVRPD